ncbi:anoctamin-8 isoform X1 [Eurytemora carolleeae]|uniref:anoctamin-8 isoform X1 n=1 Tax=Eurytemora carolleeae TaxID=1294199 RepID=UPI000C784303|nr:anoctamin-8 isoform X1 [Eurytemora carolleeae]|eukprot:XP_023320321.1 anoctamin-8-like isoform X1 [Eurytemora affinis]
MNNRCRNVLKTLMKPSDSSGFGKGGWTDAKHNLHKASKMLRRRIPQSGHLMTAKRFWLQTLPSQDCDIVLIFPPETSELTITWIRAQMQRIRELTIMTREVSISRRTRGKLAACYAFQITASYHALLQGLDELNIPKPLREDHGGGFKEFSIHEMSSFNQVETPELFLSSAERQSILFHLINSIRARPGDILENIKFRDGEAIIPKCLSKGLISEIYPLHELPVLQNLQRTWVQRIFGLQPLDDISEYFGIKISFYFAWLGHYTAALTAPAVVGTLFWIFFRGRAELIEDLGFVLFSFFNVIWATIYLATWKRRSAELAYKWGTIDNRDELLTEPRPLYKGEERISEITGKPEPYHPAWKRNCFRYFVTVPVISFSLLLVFFSVFLMLEFQEWMDRLIDEHELISVLRYLPKILLAIVIPLLDSIYNSVAIWLNEQENYKTEESYENHLIIKKTMFQFVNSFLALFYTAFYLQDMDKLKELLAALLITRQVVGNLKESILPYATKQIKLAKMSFDLFGALSPTSPEEKPFPWDYKKTDGDNNTSKEIPKDEETELPGSERTKLPGARRSELPGGTETDLPGDKGTELPIDRGAEQPEAGMEQLRRGTEPTGGDTDANGKEGRKGSRAVSQVEIEGSTPQYEGTFDDYLEMFIQFGYVTLFSSAYPLAGLCALLNNIIEIRSDAFKLCFIYQRPFSQRVKNIGSWQTAMEVMGIIGVVVNCGLIGLLGPVHRIFPNITPVQQVILIIVLEHLMILLLLLLTAAIPSTPCWVAKEMAKVEHKRREVVKNMDSFNRSLPGSVDMDEKGVQAEPNQELIQDSDSERDLSREELIKEPVNTNPSVMSVSDSSLMEQQRFLETVSNMKPEEVFTRPPNRSSFTAGTFSPVSEVPGFRQNKSLEDTNSFLSRAMSFKGLTTDFKEFRGTRLQGAFQSQGDVFRRSGSRQVSESDAYSYPNRSISGGSSERDSPLLQDIIVNDVPTPPFVTSNTSKSTPTPPHKRVLDQKEFDKKLKAKRVIFSKGRSLSLASFRLPRSLKMEKAEKVPKPPKTRFFEEKHEPRGELELLGIEQLINIHDLQDNFRS